MLLAVLCIFQFCFQNHIRVIHCVSKEKFDYAYNQHNSIIMYDTTEYYNFIYAHLLAVDSTEDGIPWDGIPIPFQTFFLLLVTDRIGLSVVLVPHCNG